MSYALVVFTAETARAITQNRVDSVTMMKLGGAGNIAESTNPPQMETKHSTLAVHLSLIHI